MRYIFTFFICCWINFELNAQNLIYASGAIPVQQAHKQGDLQVSLRGAYHPNRMQAELISSHYGKCIDIKIKNMSDTLLNVVIQCGTMLVSQDSNAQDMLVTKTIYFSLSPKEQKIDRLYAMCGELHKNAPDVLISYKVGEQAPKKLTRLAHVIEATSAQNKAGQYAVWAVTDHASRYELGDDLEVLKKSQQLLEKANIDINLVDNWDLAEDQLIDSQLVELWSLPEIAEHQTDTVSVKGQSVALQENNPIFLTRQTAKLTDDNTSEVVVGLSATLLLAGGLFFWYHKKTV